jgi:GNAT superfamily N-acetyltransferase
MNWSSSVRKKLRSLSLRGIGDMSKIIARKKCDSFVMFDGQMIVGWAIYSMEPWYSTDSGDFMIYVRKVYRKQGVGRMLLQAAVKKYGVLRIHPWDRNSGKFFSKMLGEEKSLIVARGRIYLGLDEEMT